MSDDSEFQNCQTLSDSIRVTIRLKRSDYEKLREKAEREESSISRIIRLAIKRFLNTYAEGEQ